MQSLQNSSDFLIENYNFNLPENLIAKYPKPRGESKLMLLQKNSQGEETLQHKHIFDLPNLLQKGDLLIFNDTKVIPARIFAEKLTGGKLEIMLERILSKNQILTQIKNGKSLKQGQKIKLANSYQAIFVERQNSMFVLEIQTDKDILQVLQDIGEIPLPPYIDRKIEESDKQTYQTIFAKNAGAVAAPTAGLHFNQKLLDELSAKGICYDFLTLHVGAGTFQPIRCENILEHKMHSEWIEISQSLINKILTTKAKGGRIIAVGTTSVRSLESLAQAHKGDLNALKSFAGFSDIFIYPNYKWQLVDGILTNFHLPKSSLLLLVSAFKTRETILQAYAEAINKDYRFFSYGDAMLLL